MDKIDFFIILAIVGILSMTITYNYTQSKACSERGGTYFLREGKCLDVKELK